MTNRRLEERFERFRRAGDARALAEVFDETAPELLRLARHLARRGDAEDLVQATFLLAIEKRASFDASRPLQPWLTGILVRQAAAARRTLAREVDPERLGERANPDPHELAQARELSQALGAALEKLSAADREVLIPLLLDGRRAVEIARELGRRPEAIHMRVHRGLARLRRLLPAGFAVALSRVAHSADLARVRSAVLIHAHRELGLATGAAVPFSVSGVAMSIKQLALAAAALVLALVTVGFVSGFFGGGGEDKLAPVAALAPVAVRDLRVGDVEATRGSPPAGARVPSATGAPALLELEVVRADGEPAADARFALVRADGTVVVATLDEHGRADLAPGSGEGDLFVRDSGSFPHRARLALAPARIRVELPRGEELAGRLLERDGSAAAGVGLQLTTDFEIPSLVDVPLRELGMVDGDSTQLVAHAATGPDGSFRFRGLCEGWSGELQLLAERVFVEGGAPTASNRRWLAAGGAGVVLTSARLPRLTGRLLEAGSRRPLADHRIEARIGTRDGDSTAYGARTDESGRFAIALTGSSAAVSFRLVSARDPADRCSESAEEIRWEGVRELRDLGEIEVAFEPARPLDLAVRDAAGRPIPGARIALASGRSTQCDTAGMARFAAVPLSTKRAFAAATGYAVASIELDAESTSPIEIVLRPTNELTVVLPDGVDPRNFRLEVRSSALLFGGVDRRYPQSVRGVFVGHCLGASAEPEGQPGSTSFAFADDGRVVLEGIAEGAPFRLAVESELEQVAFEADCPPMGAQERRLVRVELRSDPRDVDGARTVRGRVVDGRGRGVIGAQVGNWSRTGFDGRFSLTTSAAGPSELVVRKRGFAPAILDLASQPGSDAVVVLVRGRDLEVRVVEASGRVCEDAVVTARFEGVDEVVAERDAGGRHFLLDLPALPVLVSTDLGGRAYSVRAEPEDRTATIEVPEHGRVEVVWAAPAGLPAGSQLRLYLQLPGGAGGPVQFFEPFPSNDELALRHVLPGEYELVLEQRDGSDDASHEWFAVCGPVRIHVEPGSTQRVVLR